MNIRDYESAWLQAQVRFDQWVTKFEAAFYAPVAELMMKEMVSQLNPAQQEQLRKMNPEIYDQIMSGINVTRR